MDIECCSTRHFKGLRELDHLSSVGKQVGEQTVDVDGTCEMLDGFILEVRYCQHMHGPCLDGEHITQSGDVVDGGGLVVVLVTDAGRDDDGFDGVRKWLSPQKLRDILDSRSSVCRDPPVGRRMESQCATVRVRNHDGVVTELRERPRPAVAGVERSQAHPWSGGGGRWTRQRCRWTRK